MSWYFDTTLALLKRPSKSTVQAERHNLEHWYAREPFRSTRRAIGHIESVSVIPNGLSKSLLVRGWIFETQYALADLTIFTPERLVGCNVFGLERLDVSRNFPSLAQARLSGFLSVLPIVGAIPNTLQLRGTYHSEDGQISIIFEPSEISYGVARPGRTISRPLTCATPRDRWLAIAVGATEKPTIDTISAIVRYANHNKMSVHTFGDCAEEMFTSLAGKIPGVTFHSHRTHELAGILSCPDCSGMQLMLLGTVGEAFMREHVAPGLARTPTIAIYCSAVSDELKSYTQEWCGVLKIFKDSTVAVHTPPPTPM